MPLRRHEPAPDAARDPRWRAVVARDREADGRFLFSVRTTGVYCRPSCAARRPDPANVRFHANAADAEAAGFRPCRRCRPDLEPLARRHAALVAAACRIVDEAETPPSLASLAAGAGMSPHHFHRVFRATTGVTPRAYAEARRADRVRGALAASARVTDAIYDAGFGSSGRFYERADAMFGMVPTRFRDGGAGETIRFAAGRSSLGAVLVAAGERGVCAILIGDAPDAPDALVRDLQDRFRRARLIGADAGFEAVVAAAVGLVEAPQLGAALPLDIRGTVVQRRVWQALAGIPVGSTASYAQIAASVGQPGAARAVARACGANPLAVAIPCHRVVRIDGSPSGYRWGVERKGALLAREVAEPAVPTPPFPPRGSSGRR